MFKSFYRLEVIGKNPKQFITKLINMKISLLSVDISNKKLIIVVDEEDYLKIRDIKTTYSIEVINRYGLCKYKNILKKYSIFIISISIALFILKILSSLILNINVIHAKEEIRQIVLTDLEEYGIKPYRFKVSFDKKEKIIKEILAKEKDYLEWLEIEEVGTSYIVNVEERKKNKQQNTYEEQSVVAKKDCMILSIEASHGEVVRKKYDYVKKGDILIDGIIKNKDKAMKKIKAEGTVYGEVWYKVKAIVPYNYKEEVLTGKSKKLLKIDFLNEDYFFFNFNKYKSYKEKEHKIFKNAILPLSLTLSNLEETKLKDEIKNDEEALTKALDVTLEKLKSRLNKGDKILFRKTLKKSYKNSRIEVEVFYKVKEDITDTVSLKDIKLEDLNKEKEGE